MSLTEKIFSRGFLPNDAGLAGRQGKGRSTRYVASEGLRGEVRLHLDAGQSGSRAAD